MRKMLDNKSLFLDLAVESSKLTPHARTALRLSLLQIANRLERYAAMFESVGVAVKPFDADLPERGLGVLHWLETRAWTRATTSKPEDRSGRYRWHRRRR